MDGLVEEFNKTEGKANGILLNITSISDSATIREKLTMIAADDPGAPEMPDIATCYPQTAALLEAEGLITSLDPYFSKKELEAYLPRFLDEGRLADGLYVFPFAKSTEVLFVNQTLFDVFSEATGVRIEQLSTFEGIADAAQKYYQWTDEQTPDIIGDGKNFYTADSLFNIAQAGMQQLGSSLLKNQRLQLYSPEYQRIWSFFFEPAIKGGHAVYQGYSSDLAKVGEIICSTGSTAGILFYGTEITYPDNTTQQVEYTVLPFPTFEGGKKIAVQRGSGMIVAKSTPAKEKAAAIFLKWFTAPKQNMKFVASTGYLPVTHAAFENSIAEEIAANENINIRKLLAAAITVHKEYDFYIPPIFEGFDSISKNYEKDIKQSASEARAKYILLLETMQPDQAYSEAIKGVYEVFVEGR
jgi:multiple sugar transport system substrate-binding protein